MSIFDRCWAVALVLTGTGCGARTGLLESQPVLVSTDAGATSCGSSVPRCIVPAQACAAPRSLDASCDEATQQWSCPSGARLYVRAPEATTPCLPFRHAAGVTAIGGWGLGSFTRVPTDDGRCLWIAGTVTLSGGQVLNNAALEPDPNLPFGACPDKSIIPPTPIVTLEGGDDPSISVQINGGYRLGGVTRVLYRLFQTDPSSSVGVTELGSGIGHYDPLTQHVVIPSPNEPFPWGLDLGLGDAALLSTDATLAYVWGCARPGPFLEQGCELARIDSSDSIDLFTGGGSWIHSTDASRGATVFTSGTWISSVVAAAGALHHVYIVDYGSDLRRQTATDATGPWSGASQIAACNLPVSNPKAFCAGPVVHEEISDPTRPGELAITYCVGNNGGTSAGTTDDYWPRLVWVASPP